MLRILTVGFVATLLVAFTVRTADAGESETVRRRPQTMQTLVDDIRQAEQANGTAISAKFEFEDGKFWLSVYTAKGGRAQDAEHNTLMELRGEATTATWNPATEVFADKEHLARSAMQLTLMQLTKMDLADIVAQASNGRSGMPHSAIPAIKGGKPVVVVLFATEDGKTSAVNVDLR